MKATAKTPRQHQGRARRGESAQDAEPTGDGWILPCYPFSGTGCSGDWRRRSSGGATWRSRRTALPCCTSLHVRRSKTDPEAEGVVLYIGQEAAQALQAIMPEDEAVEGAAAPVFGLSASQIGRRVNAAAKAAGLGEGFTGHSGRVGMAQDLAASGVELPELMTAGRWKSSRMPARYTERQAAGRGAVARYYQGRRG